MGVSDKLLRTLETLVTCDCGADLSAAWRHLQEIKLYYVLRYSQAIDERWPIEEAPNGVPVWGLIQQRSKYFNPRAGTPQWLGRGPWDFDWARANVGKMARGTLGYTGASGLNVVLATLALAELATWYRRTIKPLEIVRVWEEKLRGEVQMYSTMGATGNLLIRATLRLASALVSELHARDDVGTADLIGVLAVLPSGTIDTRRLWMSSIRARPAILEEAESSDYGGDAWLAEALAGRSLRPVDGSKLERAIAECSHEEEILILSEVCLQWTAVALSTTEQLSPPFPMQPQPVAFGEPPRLASKAEYWSVFVEGLPLLGVDRRLAAWPELVPRALQASPAVESIAWYALLREVEEEKPENYLEHLPNVVSRMREILRDQHAGSDLRLVSLARLASRLGVSASELASLWAEVLLVYEGQPRALQYLLRELASRADFETLLGEPALWRSLSVPLVTEDTYVLVECIKVLCRAVGVAESLAPLLQPLQVGRLWREPTRDWRVGVAEVLHEAPQIIRSVCLEQVLALCRDLAVRQQPGVDVAVRIDAIRSLTKLSPEKAAATVRDLLAAPGASELKIARRWLRDHCVSWDTSDALPEILKLYVDAVVTLPGGAREVGQAARLLVQLAHSGVQLHVDLVSALESRAERLVKSANKVDELDSALLAIASAPASHQRTLLDLPEAEVALETVLAPPRRGSRRSSKRGAYAYFASLSEVAWGYRWHIAADATQTDEAPVVGSVGEAESAIKELMSEVERSLLEAVPDQSVMYLFQNLPRLEPTTSGPAPIKAKLALVGAHRVGVPLRAVQQVGRWVRSLHGNNRFGRHVNYLGGIRSEVSDQALSFKQKLDSAADELGMPKDEAWDLAAGWRRSEPPSWFLSRTHSDQVKALPRLWRFIRLGRISLLMTRLNSLLHDWGKIEDPESLRRRLDRAEEELIATFRMDIDRYEGLGAVLEDEANALAVSLARRGAVFEIEGDARAVMDSGVRFNLPDLVRIIQAFMQNAVERGEPPRVVSIRPEAVCVRNTVKIDSSGGEESVRSIVNDVNSYLRYGIKPKVLMPGAGLETAHEMLKRNREKLSVRCFLETALGESATIAFCVGWRGDNNSGQHA